MRAKVHKLIVHFYLQFKNITKRPINIYRELSIKRDQDMSGKNGFYPVIETSFKAQGYKYFDGDRNIKGKTSQHRRKPDYVAVKENAIIIGEIKSPNEPPMTSSWRQKQPNDSIEFAGVRADVLEREKAGKLDPEIGGHEIIIRGQIPNYVSCIGKTYDLPVDKKGKVVKGGYSVPTEQAVNVEKAFLSMGKRYCQIIYDDNGSITYIFDL